MAAVGGIEVIDLGHVASAAITIHRFVKLTTVVRTVEDCDAQGEAAIGVAQHNVETADAAEGAHVNVRLMGVSVVEANGVLALGAQVTTDAVGKAELAATGDRVLGVAMQAAAADLDLITVVLAGPAAQHLVP